MLAQCPLHLCAWLVVAALLAGMLPSSAGDNCWDSVGLEPGSLTQLTTTSTSMAVSWVPLYLSSHCSHYTNVIHKVDGSSDNSKTKLDPSTASHMLTGLSAGTNYRVKIRAKTGTNEANGDDLIQVYTTSCVAGHHPVSGVCQPCPGGSYRDTDTLGDGCTPCPLSGETSPAGSILPSACDCSLGLGRAAPSHNCTLCPAGTYGKAGGEGTGGFGDYCADCPSGTGSSGQQQLTSDAQCLCVPGKHFVVSGSPLKTCVDCPIGTYKDVLSDATSCTECDAVSETTLGPGTVSSSGCVCRPGFFRDGSGSCSPCPAGSYSDTFNALTCTNCTGGTSTPSFGATSSDNCTVCAANHYGESCTACSCISPRLCLDGKSGSGNCTCLPAGSGFSGPSCDICLETGSFYGPSCNQIVDCGVGINSGGLFGSGTCQAPCSNSRYDFGLDPSCRTCAAPNFGPDCMQCPAGSSNMGSADYAGVCVQCPAGRFKDGTDPFRGCAQCLPGSMSPSPGATACIDCVEGEYQDNPEQSVCKLCPAGTVSPPRASSSDQCTPCPVDTYKGLGPGLCQPCPFNLNTNGRTGRAEPADCGCLPGFGLTDDGSCAACPDGSVSLAHSPEPCTVCPPGTTWASSTDGCLPCPFGGYCAGSTAPAVPDYGYTLVPGAAPGSGIYEPCSPPQVCLRGGICIRGHRGERCGTCQPGWVKDPGSGLCSKCPSSIPYVFAAIGVFGALVCVVLVKIARKSTAFFAAASVGVNFVQTISVIATFDLKWPSWVRGFFSVLSATNLDFQIFKPECLVSDSSSAYKIIWHLKILSPWMLMLMLAVGYLGFRGVALVMPSRVSRGQVLGVKYAVTNATVLLSFVMYLLVTNTALEIYPCTKQPDGKYTMNREPSIRCFEGEWLDLLAVSLVSTLLFSIAMPITVGFILFRRRFALWKRKNLLRFGLVFLRYKPQYYLFEFLVLVRKGGVVVGKIAFFNTVIGQVSTALVVVIAAFALQLRTAAYSTARMNGLESLMLFCAIFVLSIAFVYAVADGSLSTTGDDAFGVILVSVVCFALVILLIAIVLEVRKTKRMLNRGLVGRYAVDRLDVWPPFFDSGMHMINHVQDGDLITITFTTESPVQLWAEMVLEAKIVSRAQAKNMGISSLVPSAPAELRPTSQAVDSSPDGCHHVLTMQSQETGHYLATLVIAPRSAQDAAPAPALAPPSQPSRWQQFVEFIDGSITDQAHAPEIVRAFMTASAQRAIRFRVTASPDWQPGDSLTGSFAQDEDLLVTVTDTFDEQELDQLELDNLL